jgi:hypothetical protein
MVMLNFLSCPLMVKHQRVFFMFFRQPSPVMAMLKRVLVKESVGSIMVVAHTIIPDF